MTARSATAYRPPTLTLPLKGGGNTKNFPSPSKGEGWGGGDTRNVNKRVSFSGRSVPAAVA